MSELNVLLTFTGGLSTALIFGYIAQRLKLSPIVGYLLAGIVVGPFTPGYTAHQAIAEQFAEIGVILLLFGIGLRFHLNELIAVWRIAVPGSLIQSMFSTAMLALLLHAFGWTWSSGIVLGLAVSVASTVVMAVVLADQHDLHAPIGHIALGWTVVEDILTVTYMLLLPLVFGQNGEVSGGTGLTLALAGLKIIGLVISVVVLGRWVIPWALERIAITRSRELFTLAVLVLALGIAVGSSKIFGVSMALGAFLAGLAVGRTEFAARAGGDALPMRDAFAVLFFVSVGMLFNPLSIVNEPLLIGVVLSVVLIGKPLSTLVTVRLLGRPLSTAIPVGAALSQIGEFSFILATVARELGLITSAGWDAMVAASIISIALNPGIYRLARRISLKKSNIAPAAAEHPVIDPNRCILVGYGPVGRTVHRLLADRGASITVIELNLNTVRHLKKNGCDALYGDVLRQGILEQAGIGNAGSLVLSADVENAAEIIRQARVLNRELRILARCAHLRDVDALRRAGASVVAAGEVEVAVALAEAVSSDDKPDHLALAVQRNAIRKHLYNNPEKTIQVSRDKG
ncbi:MAG TPA: cation:proton antiporter [Spirochaetota bacterium]|mgnify:CR=1 FL=1|nr:cation:proton antiporter [Spirochaetota bacterium]HOD14526.1 cation:proton antiporter [Spirochaetota bacterium]HPG49569.1 cation:proton antiporter [Spirochaetota bacterium]HPN13027.1 cation:proton antiporter [Spirochaetota bacterium]